MEGEKYHCQGCGSEIPASLINFKTRRAKCPWCGLDVVFPKRHSTASPNAQIALNEAMKLFLEGNYESSKSCAESALSMTNNNAAALFIVNYYKAYIAEIKNSHAMDVFFKEKLPDAEFEIEEEEMFKRLLLKTILNIGQYEEQILSKFAEYDDPNELSEFVEAFSPCLILSRSTIDWFTPNMAETYKEISKRTSIPKTWYSLYSSLIKNPDSPFVNNTFYLKTKAQRIYREFILPVGDIFSCIKDENNKQKFNNAYMKVKIAYESKMQIE